MPILVTLDETKVIPERSAAQSRDLHLISIIDLIVISRLRMTFHTEYLTFNTKTHRAYVHITPQVEAAVRKSGIKDGIVLVSAMHITAGVYVNDNEEGLIEDIDAWLEKLAPFKGTLHSLT